jgi:hypothetical protein
MVPTLSDGIKREPSQNPDPHRDLVVLYPPMEGRDVANAQRAVKERIDARGLNVPTPVHGKWTHASAVAAVEAGYFLGLESTTYLKVTKVGQDRRLVFSEGAQEIARHPDARNPKQLARAKGRQAQIERGPRYYEKLAKDLGLSSGSMENALKWAVNQSGTKESPPGSNWGHPVQDWEKLAGYIGPVPWCGCFANAVLCQGGVPSGAGWIGYTPAIIQHAKSGAGGWKWVGPGSGQRGMLALFDTPGGDPAVHVGVVLKQLRYDLYETIEGNTSAGDGSQSDGGMVAKRTRPATGSFYIVGFAVPPWLS